LNKLISPIYSKKSWGHEIIWAITDKYISKTIEIDPYKISELVVYEKREKSIIVISGQLILALGKCCDEDKIDYIKFEEGWSFYIAPGMMHRYGATEKPLCLIEVSSPEIDSAVIIGDISELEIP